MPTAQALCILTNLKDKEYINFKQALEKASGQVKVISLQNVQKKKGNAFHDKLKNVMDHCQAVLVICSESLKSYLDDGQTSYCPLLQSNERDVILEHFQKFPQKAILVALNDSAKAFVPRVLLGNSKPLDGIKDVNTIDAKIKALM